MTPAQQQQLIVSGAAGQMVSGPAGQMVSGPAGQMVSGPAGQMVSGPAGQMVSGAGHMTQGWFMNFLYILDILEQLKFVSNIKFRRLFSN